MGVNYFVNLHDIRLDEPTLHVYLWKPIRSVFLRQSVHCTGHNRNLCIFHKRDSQLFVQGPFNLIPQTVFPFNLHTKHRSFLLISSLCKLTNIGNSHHLFIQPGIDGSSVLCALLPPNWERRILLRKDLCCNLYVSLHN